MDPEVRVVPDWKLELFRLGELPPRHDAAVREAAEHDAAVRARLADLERSDRDILAAHPAGLVTAAIRTRLGAPSEARWRPRLAVEVAAAAAAALTAVSVLVLPPRRPATRDDRY